jgi:uncharacterized protein (DUF58 family)
VLTLRGLGVAAGLVVLFIFGSFVHYREVDIVVTAGVVVFVAGFGWVLRRPRLRIERSIEPNKVTRGKLALGLLSIGNPSKLAVSPTIAVEQFGPGAISVEIPRLAPGAATRTTYRLPTDHRAVIDVGPLVVTRQDPFGLWRTTQRVGSIERFWVHPVTHVVRGLPVGRTRSLDGPDADKIPQGSVTFHTLREYVVGDDLRHVHWKSSARLGTLMVREHVDTSLPLVTLVLDTSAESYQGSPELFEEAVEAAASVAVAATDGRFPVRLLTPGGQGATGRGMAPDAVELLDCLAAVQLGPEASIQELVHGLASERRGDVLVVITGVPASSQLDSIAALGKRFDTEIIGIISSNADQVRCDAPANVTVLRSATGSGFAEMWNAAAAL